jgi:transposase-like protein
VKIIEGKSVKQMHREYGVAVSTIHWWARNNNVPSIMLDEDGKKFFIFDKESEERFNNRKEYPGRQRDESIARVAEQFGVSKQCVRNWAKRINLPKNENGYIIGEKEIALFERRNENVPRGRPRKEKPEPEKRHPVLSKNGRPLGRPRKEK